MSKHGISAQERVSDARSNSIGLLGRGGNGMPRGWNTGKGKSVPVDKKVVKDYGDAKRGGDSGDGVGDGGASGKVGDGIRFGGVAKKARERGRVKSV